MNHILMAGAGLGVGGFVGWFIGRLHLRATVLKPVDRALHLPPGTLEQRVNAAVELSAEAAAVRMETKGKL